MKLLRKNGVVILGILLILLVGGIVLTKRTSITKENSTISTTRVKRGEFSKRITSSGKTKADKSVDLKFQTSGKLAWVGVKEGDLVTAGQIIAKLDDREVQKRLKDALLDYSKERNDYEQTWRVTYDGKQPSDAFNDTVKRILQKNQWDLDKAVLDVEIQSLAVEFATLTSPIAGLVTHIDTPVPGINITPASSVFTVSDPTSLVFDANIDETDVGNLAVGQPAEITLDAYPDATFSGKVAYISFSSETSAGGATVFPVKISFDSADTFRMGLNGDVSITVTRTPDVLLIPVEALRDEEKGQYVYVKTGTTYKKTQIKTGSRNDDSIIVESGLADGDAVVIKGFNSIPK